MPGKRREIGKEGRDTYKMGFGGGAWQGVSSESLTALWKLELHRQLEEPSSGEMLLAGQGLQSMLPRRLLYFVTEHAKNEKFHHTCRVFAFPSRNPLGIYILDIIYTCIIRYINIHDRQLKNSCIC